MSRCKRCGIRGSERRIRCFIGDEPGPGEARCIACQARGADQRAEREVAQPARAVEQRQNPALRHRQALRSRLDFGIACGGPAERLRSVHVCGRLGNQVVATGAAFGRWIPTFGREATIGRNRSGWSNAYANGIVRRPAGTGLRPPMRRSCSAAENPFARKAPSAPYFSWRAYPLVAASGTVIAAPPAPYFLASLAACLAASVAFIAASSAFAAAS